LLDDQDLRAEPELDLRSERLCFLHRGSHPCASAADLVALPWLALRRPSLHDTS
jgi:hypothetical protein